MNKWTQWLLGKDEGEDAMAEQVNENTGDEIEGTEEEGSEETESTEEVAPTPALMTQEAVEAMLDRQAKQFEESQKTQLGMIYQVLNPQKGPERIEKPTGAEMKEAIDGGDTDKLLELLDRKDAAIEQDYQLRLAQLENAGASQFNNVNERLLESAVPDLPKYKKEVTAMMDELGLQGATRTDPKIVELLAYAAKGKNQDAEFAALQEAGKRQQNLEQTSEPTGNRQVPAQQGGRQSAFSDDAMQSLRFSGKSNDELAKGMGYKDWEDYEKQSGEFLSQEDVVTHKWLKR